MKALPVLRPDRLPLLPAAGALASGWLSLTPSLLPRDAVFQGLLAAVAALLGYGLFAAIGWVLCAVGARVAEAQMVMLRRLLALAALLGSAAMLWLAQTWQQEQRELVGMPPASGADPFLALLVAVVGFAVLLVLARSVRALARWVGRQIARVLPARVAVACGLVLVLWASFAFVNDFAVGRVAERLDASFLLVNNDFATDTSPPAMAEVSGGPGSAVSWKSLGRQGRIFIANTPTRADIDAFFEANVAGGAGPASPETPAGSTVGVEQSEQPGALQPIRVYVGTGSPENGVELTLAQQVDTAVAELKRTGAFERKVLNVATGTGRGWVNENQSRALEYLWGGDTATVSVQYSHLPSWMSYLVDAERARKTGLALFDGVYDYWVTLPASERPKLVVSGESLGSYGSEGAFTGASDLEARTDGALWVGPTANNVLWQEFTARRDADSSVFLPTYGEGATVRFSPDGSTWSGGGKWAAPRVGYLQHANDPVTWLDFSATFAKPEFLSEDRGPGVPRQMVWIPVITTLQLAVDQLAAGIPDGQGHEFGQAPVYAWATILPPDSWPANATEPLAGWLAELRQSDLDATSSSE